MKKAVIIILSIALILSAALNVILLQKTGFNIFGKKLDGTWKGNYGNTLIINDTLVQKLYLDGAGVLLTGYLGSLGDNTITLKSKYDVWDQNDHDNPKHNMMQVPPDLQYDVMVIYTIEKLDENTITLSNPDGREYPETFARQ